MSTKTSTKSGNNTQKTTQPIPSELQNQNAKQSVQSISRENSTISTLNITPKTKSNPNYAPNVTVQSARRYHQGQDSSDQIADSAKQPKNRLKGTVNISKDILNPNKPIVSPKYALDEDLQTESSSQSHEFANKKRNGNNQSHPIVGGKMLNQKPSITKPTPKAAKKRVQANPIIDSSESNLSMSQSVNADDEDTSSHNEDAPLYCKNNTSLIINTDAKKIKILSCSESDTTPVHLTGQIVEPQSTISQKNAKINFDIQDDTVSQEKEEEDYDSYAESNQRSFSQLSMSTHSSDIDVLLIRHTSEADEGIVSMHSRQNTACNSPTKYKTRSPQDKKSSPSSPKRVSIDTSNVNQVVLTLPEKARIDTNNKEEETKPQQQQQTPKSPKRKRIEYIISPKNSTAKEKNNDTQQQEQKEQKEQKEDDKQTNDNQDDNSSSIKPEEKNDYSNSMSPLTSSTQRSYSYLNEGIDENQSPIKRQIYQNCTTSPRELKSDFYDAGEETLENEEMIRRHFHNDFQDTDSEPFVKDEDDGKKEMYAELEKNPNNEAKSSSCLLI